MSEFLHQFGGNTIAPEGALWRTLGLLLFQPGELTKRYWAGRKKRYVLPVRLYLTISLTVLALLGWFSHVDDTLDLKLDAAKAAAAGAHEAPAAATATRPIIIVRPAPSGSEDSHGDSDRESDGDKVSDKKGLGVSENGEMGFGIRVDDDGSISCFRLPDWLCHRVKSRYSSDSPLMRAELKRLPERFVSNWGTAMFVLVPLFAMWLKLVYLPRRRRYAEHLVFALHVHAFWFLALAAMTLLPGGASSAAFAAVPIYATVAAQRVYRGRWWVTGARMVVLSTLYGLSMAAGAITVLLWAAVA